MSQQLPPLDENVARRLREIRSADLLVGIPSFNNERTIGHVVRAAVSGIAKHFPDVKAVLINSDGGSRDRTREIVERTEAGNLTEILVDAAPPPADRIVTPYVGLPGKGSALRTIFRIAAELDAKACCVIDSDLRSISPGWIELLLSPVLRHGYEFVAPLYSRHRYDGTITNTIVYPSRGHSTASGFASRSAATSASPARSRPAFSTTTAGRDRWPVTASTSS